MIKLIGFGLNFFLGFLNDPALFGFCCFLIDKIEQVVNLCLFFWGILFLSRALSPFAPSELGFIKTRVFTVFIFWFFVEICWVNWVFLQLSICGNMNFEF